MKTLTLLRHAKSGWDDPALRDFDRALNDRGKRGARMMGGWAAREGMAFDQVVASPAVRCVETLGAFGEGSGTALHPVWDRRIYLASDATLLDVVHGLGDSVDRVLLCGHNPGLEDLILLLVADDAASPLRDDVEDKLPTASIAELTMAVPDWGAVVPGCATLSRFVRPRDLDPALGPQPA